MVYQTFNLNYQGQKINGSPAKTYDHFYYLRLLSAPMQGFPRISHSSIIHFNYLISR